MKLNFFHEKLQIKLSNVLFVLMVSVLLQIRKHHRKTLAKKVQQDKSFNLETISRSERIDVAYTQDYMILNVLLSLRTDVKQVAWVHNHFSWPI